MGFFEKLRRDLIFLRAALRTLGRIKPFQPKASFNAAEGIEVWAQKTPQAVAIYYKEQKVTFAELDSLANKYARWAKQQGVGKGDVVALLMENRAEYVIAWLGLIKIGAVAALINNHLRSHALAHCLDIAEADHLILGAECDQNYLSAAPFLEKPMTVWATGASIDGVRDLDPVLSELSGGVLDAESRPKMTGTDTCLYIYTSGTTGLPKAARLSHMRVCNMMHGFSAAANAKASDRMYIALPLYHSAGGVVAVGTTLTVGGAIIIANRFSARQFWSDCAKYQATMFQYIGEFCRYLLNAPEIADEKRHAIRICVGNGLRPDIWQAFQKRFKLPSILEFYGSTEGNVALLNYDGKSGAVGRVPKFLAHRYHYTVVKFDLDNQTQVRDSRGFCVEADPDEAGELLGEINEEPRAHFDGYSSQADTDEKIMRNVFKQGDAWFRTGDLMRKDADGYFYFVDRIGDTFRWKGENVATSEVAEVLSVFDGVLEANVYGVEVPHTDGRAGMAALVVEPEFNLKPFREYIVSELPDYACPVFLRMQTQMDVTGTFKQRKVDLVKEGFDPSKIDAKIYFDDPHTKEYVEVDQAKYDEICSGRIRF